MFLLYCIINNTNTNYPQQWETALKYVFLNFKLIPRVLWCSTFCWLTITHRHYVPKCCQPEGGGEFITLALWCAQHLRCTASLHYHMGRHGKPTFWRKTAYTCSLGSALSERRNIYLCCSCILNGQCCRGGRWGISRRGRSFFLGGGGE